jgi:hypothetical protein
MRTIVAVLLGSLSLLGWNGADAAPPKIFNLNLACAPGVFQSTVTNKTKKTVPLGAKIVVHGKEVPWAVNLTAWKDLKPGDSMNFNDTPPNNLVHCLATAKWTSETP